MKTWIVIGVVLFTTDAQANMMSRYCTKILSGMPELNLTVGRIVRVCDCITEYSLDRLTPDEMVSGRDTAKLHRVFSSAIKACSGV